MVDLTGRKPQNTYRDLLQVSNSNSGIDATCRNVEDGEGTQCPLALATNKVCIEFGTLEVASGVTVIIPGVTDVSGNTVFIIDGTSITIGISGATFSFCAASEVVLPDTSFCTGSTVNFTNATVTGLTLTQATFSSVTVTNILSANSIFSSSATFTDLTVTGTVNFCSATTTLGDTEFCSGSSIDFTNATVSGLSCKVSVAATAGSITLDSGTKDYTRFTAGSAVTARIPTNATTAFATGRSFILFRAGTGTLTVLYSAATITLNSVSGNTEISPQFAGATVTKVGTNEWDLIGRLA